MAVRIKWINFHKEVNKVLGNVLAVRNSHYLAITNSSFHCNLRALFWVICTNDLQNVVLWQASLKMVPIALKHILKNAMFPSTCNLTK